MDYRRDPKPLPSDFKNKVIVTQYLPLRELHKEAKTKAGVA